MASALVVVAGEAQLTAGKYTRNDPDVWRAKRIRKTVTLRFHDSTGKKGRRRRRPGGMAINPREKRGARHIKGDTEPVGRKHTGTRAPETDTLSFGQVDMDEGGPERPVEHGYRSDARVNRNEVVSA
jgi:hypothetical protein